MANKTRWIGGFLWVIEGISVTLRDGLDTFLLVLEVEKKKHGELKVG